MTTELIVEDLEEGDGDVAESGRHLTMHYTGRLTDGKVFDSSHRRKQPFEFVLGGGQVIKGWDQGIGGMKVGGKRKLTIPSDLAYGSQGFRPLIGPGATLVFEVELLAVK